MRADVDEDRGGASVLLLAVGIAFVLFGTAGAAVAAARVARQHAGVAADLGALAGAGDAVRGGAAACASAASVVSDNGGRLVYCRLDGLDVLITAEVTVTPMPGLTRVATARARAGPVRAGAATNGAGGGASPS
ncbi:Rv3654c family TadE-like protein [Micromonospora sp. WMMD558]|uniref:Rv3654c family TadE-like protein n=1 Tax=unclassified Micromonospora TaxID=2617518 RepID=UPI001E3FE25C|nr:Rv3654c family TadE-like protein [Micromonospora sp. WMMC415]